MPLKTDREGGLTERVLSLQRPEQATEQPGRCLREDRPTEGTAGAMC